MYNNNEIVIDKIGKVISIKANSTVIVLEQTWTIIYTFTDDNLLPISGLNIPILSQNSDRFIVGLAQISRTNKNIRIFFMEETNGYMFAISYNAY